jgi:tetratricopeptide (TPR) repeat protein
MDDPDFAIQVYTEILNKTTDEKKQGLFYYKIGLCYGKIKNDFSNAIINITKATELDPKNSSYYEDLGVAYGFMKDYQNAIQVFEKAIAINPDYSKIYYNLGITYKQIGQEDKANEYFAKAKQLEAGGKL